VVAAFVFASAASATFPASTNGLIVFSADTGSGFQLYTVRPTGQDMDRITNVLGDAVNAEWSPDGRAIAFELDHPNGAGCWLELMRVDGSGLRDITEDDPNICEAQPAFTRDGSRIVFERYDGYTNVDAIWSMNLKGADRHLITTGTNTASPTPTSPPTAGR
jgi:Tol biopolymer transport system component